MDLVYMVRTGECNEDLRFSLRSIAKNAPAFDNVFIVGYKPRWVSDDVIHIPTQQIMGSSPNKNTNMNLFTACSDDRISDDFVLMNDDFILMRPIANWDISLSFAKNSIKEQIAEYARAGFSGEYKSAFDNFLKFVCDMGWFDEPMNYELHFPMIINKKQYIDLFSRCEVIEFMKTHPITLKRSLYGNFYCKFAERMQDVKVRTGDPVSFATDWISVPDNFIMSPRRPKFNQMLKTMFNQCKYEKDTI